MPLPEMVMFAVTQVSALLIPEFWESPVWPMDLGGATNASRQSSDASRMRMSSPRGKNMNSGRWTHTLNVASEMFLERAPQWRQTSRKK